MPNKYRKPSTNLLQLKQKEKYLILLGKISSAKIVSDEICELEKHEYFNAHNKYMNDLNKAKTKLIKKQEREIELFYQGREYQKSKIYAEKYAHLEIEEKREAFSGARDSQWRQKKPHSAEITKKEYPSGIFNIENVEINPLLPPLDLQVSNSLSSRTNKTKIADSSRRSYTTASLNSSIWGHGVDLSHPMFSLRKTKTTDGI